MTPIYLSKSWVKSPYYLDLLKILNSLSIKELKINIVNKLISDETNSINFDKIEDEISKARIILFPVGLYSEFSTLIDFENDIAMNHSVAQLLVSNRLTTKKDKEKFHNSVDIICTFDPDSLLDALYEAMDLYSENFED